MWVREREGGREGEREQKTNQTEEADGRKGMFVWGIKSSVSYLVRVY